MAKRGIRAHFPYEQYILFVISLLLVAPSSHIFASAFCYPGCQCADELKSVECTNITSIPILFHPMLRSLSVRHSPQLALDPVSIGLYQELEFLDLSYNNIREIPDGFFGALKKLSDLRLRANKLQIFKPQVFGLAHRHTGSQIKDLDLSENEIERIIVGTHSSRYESSSALIALNLSGNQLHQLDDSFGQWAYNLRHLDLSRNRIATIGINLFNQTEQLQFLDLSENILSEIKAGVFSHQKALTHLNLARNLIGDVDASAFAGLHQLRELSLANCMISSLSTLKSNWQHVPELRSLTLSANAISELNALAFDSLHALESLTLNNMPRLRIIKNSAFSGLINLRSLTLSNCPLLEEIPTRAFGERNSVSGTLPPTQLRRLDLSANSLATLNFELLEDGWNQLNALNLTGNRWRCDCALTEFLPRVLSKAHSRSGEDTPIAYCTTPDVFFNINIQEIKHTSHCESPSRASAPVFALLTIAAAVLAALTMLMALTALICCCCWRYHYGAHASAQKTRLTRYHENCDTKKTRGRRLFYRFALPLIRRCEKPDDSSGASTARKKTIAVGAATVSTASTSSSSASSASSSYCNKASLRDACAPLYHSSTPLNESLYYDKATDDGTLEHGQCQPHGHELLNGPLGTITLYGNSAESNNEYYACIPGAPMDISRGDYCLPPPNNYCTYQRPGCRPYTATTPRVANSTSSQILIAYGADAVAYPPYLYHSESNYNVAHGAVHPGRYAAAVCTANEYDTAASSSCRCGSKVQQAHGCASVRTAPSFIAPPPPSTIPPPPSSN